MSTALAPSEITPPLVPPPLSVPMVSVIDAPKDRVGAKAELVKVTAALSPMALPPETSKMPA